MKKNPVVSSGECIHEPKKLQAVFFDFDGVIVDSCKVKKEAFRLLFSRYSEEIIVKILEHHRLHGGISRVEKIRWAHRELLRAPLNEKKLDGWARRYSALVLDAVVAVPYIAGAKEFLDFCRKELPELPLFVVSGTPEPELQEIIARRGLKDYFVEVLGSPSRKPVHIRRQLERYGLEARCCVFVGDASTDYEAAMETGLGFVGIQGEIDFPDNVPVLPDCRQLKDAVSTYGIL